jgi:hypothetical protein
LGFFIIEELEVISQHCLFRFGMVAMLGLGLTCSTEILAADKNADKNSPAAKPDSRPVPNPVVQTAAKMGVRTCLKRIDQVTSFLTREGQASAFLFPAPENIDRRLFTASLEVATPNTLAYTSTTYAPAGIDTCDGVYEAITYWPMSCKETAAKSFTQLKPIGVVMRNIQILDGGPKMRVFLMPADRGCVAIKKEVIY